MIKAILEEGYLFLAAGVLSIFAVILRVILSIGYGYLVKVSNSMDKDNTKSLEQLKKRFETMYKMNLGVKNVDIFVDKYINTIKKCGLYLSTWESISGQVRVLCVIIGIGAGIIGIYYDCGQLIILSTIGICAAGIAFTLFVDNFSSLTAKKNRFKINMSDYFENYLKVRLELPVEAKGYTASTFDEIYEVMNESSYSVYVNTKLEKAEKKYLLKRMKLEKKAQETKRKKDKKAVFAKVKKEKKSNVEEMRMKEEQEALAEMRRKRAEKQKERKEKVLEEIRKRTFEDNNEDETIDVEGAMAGMAATLEDEGEPVMKRASTIEENKLIEDVLKEFLI